MSKEFNYVRAWHELAKLAAENLNERQKTVIFKILPLVKDLRQSHNSNIPLSPEIENHIMMTMEEIAEVSRTLYYYGHWKPGNERLFFENTSGESWKIANVCDQILRKHFGIIGGLQIHEGTFRVTYLDMNNWLWEEFGLATDKNLEIYKNCKLPFSRSEFNESAEKLKKLVNDKWIMTSFMEHKPETSYDNDELKEIFQDLLKTHFIVIIGVQQVNWEPHVPVIGNYTLKHSSSGMITGSSPCDLCHNSFDSHTSNRVIILKQITGNIEGNKVILSEKEKELLKSMEEHMKQYKIDGFAFTK